MNIRIEGQETTTADQGEGLPSVRRGILTRPDGATIAYSMVAGKNPGVVFLHGYRSDMSGTKALAIETLCRGRGQAFLRFDGFGHGESSGAVEDGTIGRWVDDAVAVIEALAPGPQVLVGSSLGGWIALLTMRALRHRVAGLVGIAPAPDFTEDLIWTPLSTEQQIQLSATGEIDLESSSEGCPSWRIRSTLIAEARAHLVLRGPIPASCPIRLIHGQRDEDVPWHTSIRLADRLETDAVELILIKDGGHRLSRPEDLRRICRVVGDLLDDVAG